MLKKNISTLAFFLLSVQVWSQDTLEVNYQANILNGEIIEDYTNKWKVTFIDSAGNETPNRIWTDYGQIIELGGKRYFHRVQDLYDPKMNLQDTWINMVEHQSLVPVSFTTINPNGGFLHYQFEGNKITGNTNQLTAGKVTPLSIELDQEIYDWNLYGMLLTGLPLKEGLIAKLPIYTTQANSLSWLTATVIGKESVAALGVPTATWKVSTNQRLTFWLSETAPYVIKLELKLQNKARLVWEMIN